MTTTSNPAEPRPTAPIPVRLRSGVPVGAVVPSEVGQYPTPLRVAVCGRDGAANSLAAEVASALRYTLIGTCLEEELAGMGWSSLRDLPARAFVSLRRGMVQRQIEQAAKRQDDSVVFGQCAMDALALCLRAYARTHAEEIAAMWDLTARFASTLDVVVVVQAPSGLGGRLATTPDEWRERAQSYLLDAIVGAVVNVTPDQNAEVVKFASSVPLAVAVAKTCEAVSTAWRRRYGAALEGRSDPSAVVAGPAEVDVVEPPDLEP